MAQFPRDKAGGKEATGFRPQCVPAYLLYATRLLYCCIVQRQFQFACLSPTIMLTGKGVQHGLLLNGLRFDKNGMLWWYV